MLHDPSHYTPKPVAEEIFGDDFTKAGDSHMH
jgi:hypothetical protein